MYLHASYDGFGGTFVEAHPLDAKTAKRIPKRMIGRSLTVDEAAALLERLAVTDLDGSRPPAVRGIRPAGAFSGDGAALCTPAIPRGGITPFTQKIPLAKLFLSQILH